MTTDKGKSKSSSTRAEKMKESREKRLEARTTTEVERGFSTDQRIKLKNLKERRLERKDRNKERQLVGLSIEISAISRQIIQAEKRAEMRCSEYDPENIHWQRVDNLLQLQADTTKKLNRLYNEDNEDNFEEVDGIVGAETKMDVNKNTNIDNNDSEETNNPQASTTAGNNQSIDVENQMKRKSSKKGKGKNTAVPKKRVSWRRK